MNIITFGTFDLFHIGHLNILKRCIEYADGNNQVTVGVSTDEFNYSKKNRYPICCQHDRLEIVNNIKGITNVFYEESLEKKLEYCIQYNADVLIMGADHTGRFDYLKQHNIDVVYYPRTKGISTTEIVKKTIINVTPFLKI